MYLSTVLKRFSDISSRMQICYVGDVLPEKYASAERVDLDGRALLLCAFIGSRQELDSYLDRILGEERTAALNPIVAL